jgi:predicted GNAT family N-acyltransferase
MKIGEIPYHSQWYEKSKQLRQDVLRTPIGLILSDKDVEGEENQFHIAAIDNDEVVGVIILKPLENGVIKPRQVAIAQTMQGKGLGRDMLVFAESLARTRGFSSVEMSARISAQIFYEKLGYRTIGGIFTEVGLNTIKMIKTL